MSDLAVLLNAVRRALLCSVCAAGVVGCGPRIHKPATNSQASTAQALQRPRRKLDRRAVELLEFTLLTPVLRLLRKDPRLDPSLRARLDHVELDVVRDVTDFPSVDAATTDKGGTIHVDALYIWDRWEQFGLAAMANVAPQLFANRAHEAASRYRSRCAAAVSDGLPPPPFVLGDVRHFGDMHEAFHVSRPDISAALESEQVKVASSYMAFAMLHELGHVAQSASGRTFDAQRDAEFDADGFAFKQLFRMGASLDLLESALETEAVTHQICRLAGASQPASHPTWRERVAALRAFERTHPPQGPWISLSGWSEDPTAKKFVALELRVPRDVHSAGRSSGTVTISNHRFDAIEREKNGVHTIRWRRDSEIHELDVWNARGYRPRALWGVTSHGILVGERHFAMRTYQQLAMLDLLVPTSEWETLPPRQFEERALDKAGVAGAKRAAVMAIWEAQWKKADQSLEHEIETGEPEPAASFDDTMHRIELELGPEVYKRYRKERFK